MEYTLNLNGMDMIILFDIIPVQARAKDAIIYARMRRKVALTEEQRETAEVVQTQVGPGQFSVDCKDKETRWPVVFTEQEMEVLISLCRQYTGWPSSDDTVHLVGQLEDVSGMSILEDVQEDK